MRWIETVCGAAVALALGSALGCATASEQRPSNRDAAATAVAPPGNAPAAASLEAGPGAPPMPWEDAGADAGVIAEPLPAAALKKRTGELARFYSALDGLENHTRKEHVRILWLGDSHGQADFWSGRLRSALQKRFGNGGPGFVYIAFKGYRHDGVEVAIKDKWQMLPRGPSTSVPTADGIFGLGGVLTSPKNAGASASVEVMDSTLPKKLQWDLCYRLSKPTDVVSVSLPGYPDFTLRHPAGAAMPEKPPLLHASFTTDTAVQVAKPKNKGPRLTVSPGSGYPAFCGVSIETDPAESPGVVLDTLGINGARYTTALAWDEEAWVSEYVRRSPSLVIFEYGTNEAGDVGVKAETYADKVGKLVARIRKKKPDTDCVVLAPTERADQEERSARVRDILRDAARANVCAFWDTIATMGGKGAMRAWRDANPPRGAKDGIHLTVRGYFELGDKLAVDLLKKY